MAFLHEYRNKLIELANGYFGSAYVAARSIDPEVYHWLTLNVNKAQRLVGPFGIGTYIAAFQSYRIDNCRFLVNLIPNFQTGTIAQQEMSILDTSLTTALGAYQEVAEENRKSLRNPFKWFQYGIRSILSFPVRLLGWLGIISERSAERITSNAIFKVFTGIIGLISFASSVTGLIGGWQPFIDVLHNWFPKYFK